MNITKKDFENAKRYLHDAFDLSPDAAQLHVLSGNMFTIMGDMARSQKRYRDAFIHYKSARREYDKALDDPEWGPYATKGFNKVDALLKPLEDWHFFYGE